MSSLYLYQSSTNNLTVFLNSSASNLTTNVTNSVSNKPNNLSVTAFSDGVVGRIPQLNSYSISTDSLRKLSVAQDQCGTKAVLQSRSHVQEAEKEIERFLVNRDLCECNPAFLTGCDLLRDEDNSMGFNATKLISTMLDSAQEGWKFSMSLATKLQEDIERSGQKVTLRLKLAAALGKVGGAFDCGLTIEKFLEQGDTKFKAVVLGTAQCASEFAVTSSITSVATKLLMLIPHVRVGIWGAAALSYGASWIYSKLVDKNSDGVHDYLVSDGSQVATLSESAGNLLMFLQPFFRALFPNDEEENKPIKLSSELSCSITNGGSSWTEYMGRDLGLINQCGVSKDEFLNMPCNTFLNNRKSEYGGEDYVFIRSGEQLCTPSRSASEVIGLNPIAETSNINFHQGMVAVQRVDPLVLDICGMGINLTGVGDSNVLFDLDNDGHAERTGWIQGCLGILAVDLNNNANIDNINEVFGNATTSGFIELRRFDSDRNNIININDTNYTRLRIWQDHNQNGISEAGELTSLRDFNVTSISLNVVDIAQESNGNLIIEESTFTRSNNATEGRIVEVLFALNQGDALFVGEESHAERSINGEALFLPISRGYGELTSWHIAATNNVRLFSMLKSLSLPERG